MSGGVLASSPPNEACGEDPSILCKLMWAATGNEDVTAFYDDWFDDLVSGLIKIIVVLVGALLLRRVAHRMITKVMDRMAEGIGPGRPADRTRTAFGGSTLLLSERRRQRYGTVGSVLRSVATVVIFGVAAMTILGQLGFNLGPVLASAGIVGVAVGFGAQNLVRDFLSGIAMLLEDQYGVGDWVDLGEMQGSVEAVSLRITRLRDMEGTVWYVRNGEIMRVGNSSQGWAEAVVDVPVSFDEDVRRVRWLMEEVGAGFREQGDWEGVVLEDPGVWGVQDLSSEVMVMRMSVKTAPSRQWEVARALRERLKERLDAAGVSVGSTFIGRDLIVPPRRSPESADG